MACRTKRKQLDYTSGNQKEDWLIFDILCTQNSEMEEDAHDAMTALKSELAALQYKRDRLLSELNEMRAQVRCRDQRTVELETETENLREQTARQNAIIASLKKRIQELEEKERALSIAQGRSETAIQTLQRENKYQEDKAKELGRRIRALEMECHAEEQSKLAAREAMSDFVRKLSSALGVLETTDLHSSQECLVHKAADLVLETTSLRSRASNLTENLSAIELELKGCREALERAVAERDNFQRQAASHLLELDKLKQEKEELEIQQRMAERKLCELREKLAFANKNLGTANVNNAAQEATINQLRDSRQALQNSPFLVIFAAKLVLCLLPDETSMHKIYSDTQNLAELICERITAKNECKIKDERGHRLQTEMRHLLDTLAITLSTPTRFVESTEEGVKCRVKEVVQENKEKTLQSESLREKVGALTTQLEKQSENEEQVNHQIRILEDEKTVLESRLAKMEEDLHNCDLARESLRADKATFMSFLERLAKALKSEEVTKDMELDLLAESLLLRAEQMSRLEADKIINKTSAMYQMQRKLRTLKEQLQRKDLHLDLLRRKIAAQEETFRTRSTIAIERDEATIKCKKLMKQVEKLQLQLADGRSLSQDLKSQLAEAGDFKIAALERGRKVEELQKRLVDAENIITRLNKKMTVIKEQLRNTGESADQERTISEHSLQLLRDDLANTKLSLAESTRRENQLHGFRNSTCKILGLLCTATDFEIISKLEKLVAAHRDFTLLSRRYEDPISGTSPTPIRTPKYEDSGFLDQQDLSALEDNDDIFHKHSLRN